ncbi:hypothetical protein MIT9_P0034 [Methylomarinovum caldicuralii]|uniref:PilZ domain-containing protein n=1 Tax=Methylomarinovum caldicuralii TaxID=438856 RepID=A0AAU9CG05_9GAMM|nr:PilZ domain-containing protein [Methylomarinovum caldicuralii]BCX80461.1 hypothetical protein MIT9_P0034 [Methylomarinovum caldicuralii]
MTEQRRDPRVPLPGLQIEIHRSGWKPASGHQSCRLVDLGPNGLAFVTHHADLNPTDKVGFRLLLHGREAAGRAVICYRRQQGAGFWRYGAMFLSVAPEVQELLQEAEQDPAEVRAAARSMAEEMVLARCRDAGERELLYRQWLLQEAVNAWLGRLAELNHRLPVQVLVDRRGVVRIDGPEPVTIAAVPGRSGYASARGQYFATVFDVLEYLRQTLGK